MIKEMFFHDDHLPPDGWFHCCLKCSTITSNQIFLKKRDDIEYYPYICRSCNKFIVKTPLMQSWGYIGGYCLSRRASIGLT